jgi:type VI secretion system secreted protein VgrG
MPRRPLSSVEIAEARRVFGDGLNYSRAAVIENTSFPNLVARVGRAPRPNAITLGNVSYFPETLKTSARDIAGGSLRGMAWLIHELTHQWQYQYMGWAYLHRALWVHLRLGQNGYHYRIEAGKRLADYNLEQQGDIARDYYCALKVGRNCARTVSLDPQLLETLIAEFRNPVILPA